MLVGQLLHELFQRVLLKLKSSQYLVKGRPEDVIRGEIENVLSTVETLDKL